MQALGPESSRALLHWDRVGAISRAVKTREPALRWLRRRQDEMQRVLRAHYRIGRRGRLRAMIPQGRTYTPTLAADQNKELIRVLADYMDRIKSTELHGRKIIRTIDDWAERYPDLFRGSYL